MAVGPGRRGWQSLSSGRPFDPHPSPARSPCSCTSDPLFSEWARHEPRRPVSTGHRGKTDQMSEFTFAPLTPASFLDRAAAVFADRTAIVDGERRLTYRDMSDRCRRLAGALAAQGVGREDRIAALCTNSHVMLELHNAVPMMGAVLV